METAKAGAQAPNIVLIMADQMAAAPLPAYGGRVVKAPHLSRLADAGVVFEQAYCNSPICAPSRFSMLSGRLPTAIDAFDNASEFAASTPTLAHYLCAAGYQTILSGKMHFIGPDQLHGYEERLVTDIYPADFSWTPNWLAGPADKPSGISMRNVVQAGHCVRSLQMDYDDEVEFWALQKLYDLAREPQRKPFFLTVSFSHPHPPFTAGRQYWDRYDHDEIDMPAVAPIAPAERDVQSQWLHVSHGADQQPITEVQLRNARHAYYAMISYVDDKVGRLLDTLDACDLRRDTVVIFTSDHGEMLGERGMWYKQSFFEPSVRVPLIVSAAGPGPARRVAAPVSLLDLMPSVMDLAGAQPEWADPIDGASFVPLMQGAQPAAARAVISEYTDMGVIAPVRMIRAGDHKYIYTHGHPGQLYDLRADPQELHDLAGRPGLAGLEAGLRAGVLENWDPQALHRRILDSQRRRLFLKQAAQASGRYPDWSYQAARDDTRRFVRASGAAGAKARARFPFVAPDAQ
jgi:choline-sulfatase